MGAKVVPTARLRPGKCAITKDTTGPFIDTGTNVHRWGRIYLSIPGLRDVLRSEGFLVPEETEALREDNERLQEEVRRLTTIEDAYNTLVDAVAPHIEVEPEVVTQTVVNTRAPSDEEIEDWIRERGGDHPAVKAARPLVKGSPEEWRALYGEIPPGHPQFSKAPKAGSASTTAQDLASEYEGNVIEVNKSGTFVVQIHEQDVDLYKVLDQNVGDVLKWADGHDEETHESLVDAEYHRAREQSREPRKGVIEGLGYEYQSTEDYFASEPDETSEEEDEQELDLTGLDDGDGVGEDDEDLAEDEES